MSYFIEKRKKFGKIVIHHFSGIFTREGPNFWQVTTFVMFWPLVTLNIDWLLFCCIRLVADTMNFILSGNMSESVDSSRSCSNFNCTWSSLFLSPWVSQDMIDFHMRNIFSFNGNHQCSRMFILVIRLQVCLNLSTRSTPPPRSCNGIQGYPRHTFTTIRLLLTPSTASHPHIFLRMHKLPLFIRKPSFSFRWIPICWKSDSSPPHPPFQIPNEHFLNIF